MHCKSYLLFFSKKIQHICISLNVHFNESLTNNVVSFEQMGPGIICIHHVIKGKFVLIVLISGLTGGTQISRLGLFKLPGYAGICLTYGVVSLIQYGVLQWGPLYLVQNKKHSIITGKVQCFTLQRTC